MRYACRLGTPSDLHVQALATTMKRAVASDHEFHGTPQAKRPASLPVDSFINALSTAGDSRLETKNMAIGLIFGWDTQ